MFTLTRYNILATTATNFTYRRLKYNHNSTIPSTTTTSIIRTAWFLPTTKWKCANDGILRKPCHSEFHQYTLHNADWTWPGWPNHCLKAWASIFTKKTNVTMIVFSFVIILKNIQKKLCTKLLLQNHLFHIPTFSVCFTYFFSKFMYALPTFVASFCMLYLLFLASFCMRYHTLMDLVSWT